MAISFTWTVDDVPTNADSVKMSDPTAAYGLRRSDTAEVIVADDVAWTNTGAGTYEFDLDPYDLELDVVYDYWIEVVYDSETTRIQRFITGDEEGIDSIGLRFILIDEGTPTLATTVKLSNPTGSYGVVRLDTGETVVADGANFTASGTLYSAGFGEPAENLTYRYYVEAVYDGVTYHLPRTTAYTKSAALVLGRYTNSVKVESLYGVENLAKSLGIDESDEAVDYALRLWDHIYYVEAHIDDALRPAGLPVAATPTIERIASLLVGVRAYEARGVVDMNPATGEPMHRLHYQKKEAEKLIEDIKRGKVRLEDDDLIRYPIVVD